MKILIAPDSFKETLTALEVADAIETGFHQVYPEADYVICPVADGGEGSVDALVRASDGHWVEVRVCGPLGVPTDARYGVSGDGQTAYIEMAAASGIELISPEERNPLIATSFGTGQLMLHALDQGIRQMIVCIGGSATNDGGAGMVQALGACLTNSSGQELAPGGAALSQLAQIDVSGLDSRLGQCDIQVACDVTNPLTGDQGASAVYGPQKGATPEMVQILDQALANYARVISVDLGQDIEHLPGAGAAGGMGAAFYGFLNARLRPGIDILTEAVGLDTLLVDTDLVITGEGRLDSQSVNGKVPVGVAHLAKIQGKPVVALAGALGDDIEEVYSHGIDAAFDSIYKITTFSQVQADARNNLVRASRNIAAAIQLGQSMVTKS